jgi:hypothetical protein
MGMPNDWLGISMPATLSNDPMKVMAKVGGDRRQKRRSGLSSCHIWYLLRAVDYQMISRFKITRCKIKSELLHLNAIFSLRYFIHWCSFAASDCFSL